MSDKLTGNTVSVIVVSYKTGDVLWPVIDSVLEQENLVELIIVNNGNPRHFIERLKRLSEKHSTIRIVNGHKNMGLAAGNNLGAEHANGKYLLFLSPDCLLQKNGVRHMVDAFNAMPESWAAGCRIVNSDGSDQRGSRRNMLSAPTLLSEIFNLYRMPLFGRNFSRLNTHDNTFPHNHYVPVINSAVFLILQKRFWHEGGFDESYFLYGEDYDFCKHIADCDRKVLFVSNVKAMNYLNRSHIYHIKVEWYKAKGLTRYFYKHYSGAYITGILFFITCVLYSRFLFRSVYLTFKKALRIITRTKLNKPQKIGQN